MASLIESVRKLHGPTLVEHDNGYDVDVICPECTRLRTEVLEKANTDSVDGAHAAELAHVPYPCPTRIIAGTTAAEGKDESARMRLEHLVVQREQLEERMERLDAVIGLIRRDLGEITSEAPALEVSAVEEPAKSSTAKAKQSDWDTDDEPMSPNPGATPDDADGYDF
ncbi:hypothetical protein ACIGH6_13435 [Brachybacterium paraconglomeratum]|uniref:hypothetical protein n=1 Tax=Brachybacterium paraconglomeratum TaxID=173362 RepID=UPI0037C972AE